MWDFKVHRCCTSSSSGRLSNLLAHLSSMRALNEVACTVFAAQIVQMQELEQICLHPARNGGAYRHQAYVTFGGLLKALLRMEGSCAAGHIVEA